MPIGKNITKIVHFLLHLLSHLVFADFTFFSHGVCFVCKEIFLENKEELIHFRVYGKSVARAQTDEEE